MRSILSRKPILSWVSILCAGLFILSCSGGEQKSAKTPPAQKQEQVQAYDETADAHADIATAIQRARPTGKRILLVFGANWCPWCRALHQLFETDEEIKQVLKDHFEVVMVDVGRRDKHMDIDAKYGSPAANGGIPVIVILDSNGEYLATQDTGSLERPKEKGKPLGHDRGKVLAFLHKWIAMNGS